MNRQQNLGDIYTERILKLHIVKGDMPGKESITRTLKFYTQFRKV